MTVDYYPLDHAVLGRIANRIINEVRCINRVTYDVTSKPAGTIEWGTGIMIVSVAAAVFRWLDTSFGAVF